MAPKDMKKTALVTKIGLYDWTVMPFGLKNATSTFTKTMLLVFKELGDKFLKVFVDDLNVHNEIGKTICYTWKLYFPSSGK